MLRLLVAGAILSSGASGFRLRCLRQGIMVSGLHGDPEQFSNAGATSSLLLLGSEDNGS